MTKTIVFWGKVREGEKRGKALGFPTANLSLTKKIPEGIYISRTKIRRDWHQSLTFIGKAKTFDEKKYQSETYILSFDKNIYNTWISTRLLKKIRDNKKFASEAALIKEMKNDEKIAKDYFENNT